MLRHKHVLSILWCSNLHQSMLRTTEAEPNLPVPFKKLWIATSSDWLFGPDFRQRFHPIPFPMLLLLYKSNVSMVICSPLNHLIFFFFLNETESVEVYCWYYTSVAGGSSGLGWGICLSSWGMCVKITEYVFDECIVFVLYHL